MATISKKVLKSPYLSYGLTDWYEIWHSDLQTALAVKISDV